MIEAKDYKIATYQGGEFVKYGYPHRFLNVKIDGLVDDITFYLVETIQPETYNPDQFNKKELPLELTTIKSDFDNILIAYQKFELVEYSEAVIIQKIENRCEQHIENTLPLNMQTSNISRFLYLQIMQNEEYTQDRADEMAFLNSVDNWIIACRKLKDQRIEDYKINGDFPELNTWPEMPIKL